MVTVVPMVIDITIDTIITIEKGGPDLIHIGTLEGVEVILILIFNKMKITTIIVMMIIKIGYLF